MRSSSSCPFCAILAVAILFALGLGGCGPRASEPDAARLLRTGWDQYRYGDFDSATRSFEKVAEQAEAGSEARTMALYALGTTWDLRRPNEDTQRARQYYREAGENEPESDLAAWSLLSIARMEDLLPVGQEPDRDKARAAYQQVIDRFPTHPAGEEAFLYQQAEYLATQEPADARIALAALQQYLRDRPETLYISSVHGLIGTAYDLLDEERLALESSILSLETREFNPRNPARDNASAYWSTATKAQYVLGDFDIARKYYRRLIQEYPSDQRVFPAELALQQMDELEEKLRREATASTP